MMTFQPIYSQGKRILPGLKPRRTRMILASLTAESLWKAMKGGRAHSEARRGRLDVMGPHCPGRVNL